MNRRASTLVEDLVHHLRGRLLAGSYEAGGRISESGVASEYGVARPTARTALDILTSEGLLVKNPFAAFSVPRVEAADMAELSALLEVIERMALSRISGADPDLREMRDGTALSVHFFLDAVVRGAGSERLARIHRQATFELLMGLAQADIEATEATAEIRGEMDATVGALWSKDYTAAATHLGQLQAWRAAALTPVTSRS